MIVSYRIVFRVVSYVTPKSPKRWHRGTKRDFAVIASKIQLLTKEVCYKVFLCENFVDPVYHNLCWDLGGVV